MINLRIRYALGAVLILLCFAGYSLAEGETPAKAAEVNGKVISYDDFQRRFELVLQQQLKGRPGKVPEDVTQKLRPLVLNEMISEELLFQESEKKGIKVPPEVVEKELNDHKQSFKDPGQYEETLKRMQITEERLKKQIVYYKAIGGLVNQEIVVKIKVTDEDAKAYFDKNTEKFRRPERVRAQHILIKADNQSDKEKKADARKRLEDIKKRLLSGEDFGELAKTYSEGPSKVRGGDLNYFTRGQMVKNFEDVAFKLAPNEISDIVETRFGYHLIKVIDHQAEKTPTFDEVKPKLIRWMHSEKVKKNLKPYVAKLRENATVETFIQ